MTDFVDYLDTCYMKHNSTFPPEMWAGIDDDVTTTNACEAFHRQLEHDFTSHHPSLWNFVLAIADEQKKSELKIRSKEPVIIKKGRQKAK